MQGKCDGLNYIRKDCVSALECIESAINSIANTPKKIDRSVSNISIERVKYRDTKSFTKEAVLNAAVNGAIGGAGIGVAVAGLKTRNPIMKIIFLILSPILILFSIFSFCKKDKKIAIDANSDAKSLNTATAQLRRKGAEITDIHKKTSLIYTKLTQQVTIARPVFGRDYKDMSGDEKRQLGAIVNNTLSLAEMLNKTAEQK